jgi:hypothetical protein
VSQGAAPIHEAVIVRKALESVGVRRRRGCKPATKDVNVCWGTIGHARIDYLNTESRHSWWAITSLGYANVFIGAFICNIHHIDTRLFLWMTARGFFLVKAILTFNSCIFAIKLVNYKAIHLCNIRSTPGMNIKSFKTSQSRITRIRKTVVIISLTGSASPTAAHK